MPIGRRAAALVRMAPLAAALGALVLLGGCGETLDERLGVVPAPSTNPDQPALPRATDPNLPYPNLASVPPRPTDWSTPAERARQLKALSADQKRAAADAAAIARAPAAVQAAATAAGKAADKANGGGNGSPAQGGDASKGADGTPPANDTVVPADIVPVPDAPPALPQTPALPGS